LIKIKTHFHKTRTTTKTELTKFRFEQTWKIKALLTHSQNECTYNKYNKGISKEVDDNELIIKLITNFHNFS
jgi:hypothetical protein